MNRQCRQRKWFQKLKKKNTAKTIIKLKRNYLKTTKTNFGFHKYDEKRLYKT